MINIHRKYLFNKINLIVILIIIIINFISIFLISNPFTDIEIKYLDRTSFNNNYLNSLIYITKFCLVTISIFFIGSSFSSLNDGYKCYLINYKKDKIRYFLSKTSLLIFIQLLISLAIYLFGIFIFIIFTNWKVDIKTFSVSFIQLVLFSLVYGMISLFFIINIKSIFILLVPFFLFILNEILIDYNYSFIEWFNIIIPSFSLSNVSIYEIIHLIILFGLYYLFNLINYYKKG